MALGKIWVVYQILGHLFEALSRFAEFLQEIIILPNRTFVHSMSKWMYANDAKFTLFSASSDMDLASTRDEGSPSRIALLKSSKYQ